MPSPYVTSTLIALTFQVVLCVTPSLGELSLPPVGRRGLLPSPSGATGSVSGTNYQAAVPQRYWYLRTNGAALLRPCEGCLLRQAVELDVQVLEVARIHLRAKGDRCGDSRHTVSLLGRPARRGGVPRVDTLLDDRCKARIIARIAAEGPIRAKGGRHPRHGNIGGITVCKGDACRSALLRQAKPKRSCEELHA